MILSAAFSALYEAVQSKKTLWDEAQKSMGEEIETLFDRLIFDNHDANSSHMLLLINASGAGGVLSP
ncbi:sigma-54 dependent transcriptional regulator [Klebsiella variicola]|nr:sigma-54 dependent transcriptional regulator [Klebsiella variicola]